MNAVSVVSLHELVEAGIVQLTRGKVISKKDIAACPGNFPIYSSAKDNDGKFGEYGKFLFDEELITWSVDGGGRLFHRPKHKFSVTNVGGILRILDKAVLDYRYLYYVLSLRHSEIRFDWVRKAHPSVIQKLYKQIPVLVLSEQRRIVAILDEAFEGIATAKANAEKNLQNARGIFESLLASKFVRNNDEVSLSELTTDITDGDHMPPPKASTGVPFITISNIVKRTREVDFTKTFTVPTEYFNNLKPNKKPRVGDILYTVTGATLGIPVLVKEQRDFCFQRHIGLVRPKTGVDSKWLAYALLSPQVFSQATIGSTGAAQKTVSLKVLRGIQVPRSLRSEQARIANQLDAIAVETEHLVTVYERKLAVLDALKKSLLHQAFAGELTSSKTTKLIEAMA
jgi:restriction endonuclease S subunit